MTEKAINDSEFHKTPLIIFDWDGTLFDSTAVIAHSLCHAASDLHLPEFTLQQARHVIGLGMTEAIQQLMGTLSPADTTAFVNRYRHYFFAEQTQVHLFEGMLPLLESLHTEHRYLAVATGMSRAGLNRAFAQHPDLKKLFTTTRTADETASKPQPQMLKEILDELNLSAKHAVMVGDTEYDIAMAHAADMRSIAVSYGAHTSAQLQLARPSYLAHSVEELGARIQKKDVLS